MGLGLGVILLVLGLVLVTGVGDWATPLVPESTLGWLLIICGAAAVVASLFVSERLPASPVQRRHKD